MTVTQCIVAVRMAFPEMSTVQLTAHWHSRIAAALVPGGRLALPPERPHVPAAAVHRAATRVVGESAFPTMRTMTR